MFACGLSHNHCSWTRLRSTVSCSLIGPRRMHALPFERRIRRSLLSAEERTTRFGHYSLVVSTNQPAPTLADPHSAIPPAIARPQYDQNTGNPLIVLEHPHINSPEEIEGMRAAGRLAAQVLQTAVSYVASKGPGISTNDIDRIVHVAIIEAGAYPSPLGYMGFPKSVCTSVNNILCHGIPDDRLLQDGDIVNIDVTVYLNGFHGDTSKTVLVGQVDDAGKLLVKTTREAFESAIEACGPGVPFSRIGEVLSSIADANGYSISREFCGHGIGRQFHQPPLVQHHQNDSNDIMMPGMTFTIEPIFCQGSARYTKWADGWTIATLDGGRAAQFEHTLLVQDSGMQILTLAES